MPEPPSMIMTCSNTAAHIHDAFTSLCILLNALCRLGIIIVIELHNEDCHACPVRRPDDTHGESFAVHCETKPCLKYRA